MSTFCAKNYYESRLGRISGLTSYPADQARYPVFKANLTEIIQLDIRQFSLLYQTTLILSGRISGSTLFETLGQIKITKLRVSSYFNIYG